MSPEDLVQVLQAMPPMAHPDLLEGFDKFADAGVFRLREDLAIVQTVDFFPPIVDDPEDYGRIAAANSLSDVYAMGGKPITALSIVGFPDHLDPALLGRICAGGAQKTLEAGAIIVGGHSVVDQEIKYGLAVTGLVHPAELVRNSGARAGDVLVLTKPLGTGAISTGAKSRKVDGEVLRAAVACMSKLNRDASECMKRARAHSATDITGFGLLGHGREMAEASGVTLSIDADLVPLLPGARALAKRKILSGGAARNRAFLAERVTVDPRVAPDLAPLLFDSETSGGLLIALPGESAGGLIEEMRKRGHAETVVIGRVLPRGARLIQVTAGG
jgi:selenide,water dikinase